jgi:hypothetical protein
VPYSLPYDAVLPLTHVELAIILVLADFAVISKVFAWWFKMVVSSLAKSMS